MDEPEINSFQVNRGNQIKAHIRGFKSMPDKTKEAILIMVECAHEQIIKEIKLEKLRG